MAVRGKAQPGTSAQSEAFLTIQALRFVAAFAVVVLHCSFYTSERLSDTLGIYTLGANGVRLFFVISGFVMVMSSHRLEGTPLGWRVFACKRVVRIVPMYWLVTSFKLATLLAVPAVVLHAKIDWGYIAQSYLFVPAYNVDGEIHPLLGVGWTLNFEMFFYVLFMAALALKVSPMRFVSPVLIALSLLSLVKTPQWPVPLQFWCNPVVLDFLAGMLLAQALRKGLVLPRAVAWLSLILGLAYLFTDVPRPGAYGTLAFSLGMTIASLMVVAAAVALERTIAPVLPRWMLFMGAASYVLYLIHPVIAPVAPALFSKLGLHWPLLSVLASITIAMIAGAAMYWLIERPVTRWLNGNARARGLYDAVSATAPAVRADPAPLSVKK